MFETSNIFREKLELERLTWSEEKEIPRKVEFEEVKDDRRLVFGLD